MTCITLDINANKSGQYWNDNFFLKLSIIILFEKKSENLSKHDKIYLEKQSKTSSCISHNQGMETLKFLIWFIKVFFKVKNTQLEAA